MADENQKHFWEKIKSGKVSKESEIFFGNRGESETEGMHHSLRGDGRLCFAHSLLFTLNRPKHSLCNLRNTQHKRPHTQNKHTHNGISTRTPADILVHLHTHTHTHTLTHTHIYSTTYKQTHIIIYIQL